MQGHQDNSMTPMTLNWDVWMNAEMNLIAKTINDKSVLQYWQTKGWSIDTPHYPEWEAMEWAMIESPPSREDGHVRWPWFFAHR